MTRDDIISMAREIGSVDGDHGVFFFYPDELERFAALVAQAERKPLTNEHGPQYQVINQQGRWQLVYDQQHHEFRIIKLRHDIWLYPGIELIQAHKRFFEHVENDNE